MSSLPAITWPEVRDHVVRRLMLDEEWTVHEHESLVWQPWILPVHIGVYEHGQYADGFPFMSVKAWTRVAEVDDDELGLHLAERGNASCPMATFFYDGSLVMAVCGVSLNADGRSNLALFHNAVLAMTTAAHELASEAEGLVPELDDEEAKLGRRHVPDELLGIFAGEGTRLPGETEFPDDWRAARPRLAEIMASAGHEPGYTDSSVDFYDMRGAWVGVGLPQRTDRYGEGLDVLAIVWTATSPESPYPEYSNDINELLGARAVSNIGNANWADAGEGAGSLLIASYLPWAYLGEFHKDPQELAAAVFNALTQVALTSRAITKAAANEVSAV